MDHSDISYGACRRCGGCFVRRDGSVGAFCSDRCRKRAHKNTRKHRERTNGAAERFTLREIAERDGWRCHLCGKRVPDREYAARPDDPTIDHLIPVSDGGLHVRTNVALAHNRCNYERNTGGVAQLLLVG
jgi:5-methylcytosine-specific restriction endonuclease McrA